MNARLQVILITASLLFFFYIAVMVRGRRIELKYTLSWLLAGLFLMTAAVSPSLIDSISIVLNIVEPVNTLFLLIIFFLMLILFTMTIALSRSSSRVKTLVQEIGIIKLELEKLRKDESK